MPKVELIEDELMGDNEPEDPEKLFTLTGDIKADPEPRQHVPYILNGELYRIESQVGDNVTVRCCSCPPDRIYRGSVRSTGNFHMHIKRRHASLLGRLHEMKVAALVERRDRIMKNRREAKCRKKSTTPAAIAAAAFNSDSVSGAEEEKPKIKRSATHELKIKTVFQRHKQEHHKQEVAAAIRRSVSLCDSMLDNISQSSNQDNNNNSNAAITNNNENNDINSLKNHSSAVMNQNLGINSTPLLQPNGDVAAVPPILSLPRLMAYNSIKPEQQAQLGTDQPEAIDLSRSSSLQSDDTNQSVLSHSMQNVQFSVSHGQELSTYINGNPREILIRIDNTLADIKDELQTRNQIERRRLLFDMAKFQYLNPNFHFDAAQ